MSNFQVTICVIPDDFENNSERLQLVESFLENLPTIDFDDLDIENGVLGFVVDEITPKVQEALDFVFKTSWVVELTVRKGQ